ncbi:MAG: hypothetical protein RBS13_07580, partial [Bacteroidales bacterium]|nr:hypothetical protein [Bacteroidales bacterium]
YYPQPLTTRRLIIYFYTLHYTTKMPFCQYIVYTMRPCHNILYLLLPNSLADFDASTAHALRKFGQYKC